MRQMTFLGPVFDAFTFFPYERPNEYQERILRESFDEKITMLEAPVGTGKTAAGLAIGLEAAIRLRLRGVLIFTRTHSQMRSYLNELSQLNEKHSIPYVAFLGKHRLCKFSEDPVARELIKFQGGCDAYACPLKQKYDEKKEAYKPGELGKKEWVTFRENIFTIRSVEDEISFLESFTDWCPYYLHREFLRFSRVIVTTYANASLSGLGLLEKFADSFLNDFVAIVDEAHNFAVPEKYSILSSLLDKGLSFIHQDYLVKSLWNHKFLRGIDLNDDVEYSLEKVNEVISTRISCGREVPPFLAETKVFLEFWKQGIAWIASSNANVIIPDVTSRFQHFLRAKKLILLSATLSPPKIYAELFGLSSLKILKISVAVEKRLEYFGLILPFLTSRYHDRSHSVLRHFSIIVSELQKCSRKNVLVIVPSYEFASQISSYINPLWFEQQGQSIDSLFSVSSGRLVGKIIMAVNGGRIMEGLNMVQGGGSIFDIVVFLGIPFPPPSLEQHLIQEFLSEKHNEEVGKFVSKELPVIRSLIQAVGRATRSSRDKGVGIILDHRVNWVAKYLPIRVFRNKNELYAEIMRFLGTSAF